MPAFEIDEIFANKPKAKTTSPTEPAHPVLSKKKKRGQKLPVIIQDTASPPTDAKPSGKRPIPETVVDSSTRSVSTKRQKSDADASRQHKNTTVDPKRDEQLFRDSRGTAPRRKTEDGYNIYKEDELGISNAGGDTPLCPFDCNCCF